MQVGAGPRDFVWDGAVQEVGGVPRGGAGAAAAEEGRPQEEEDHQQAQGDAPDRRVSRVAMTPLIFDSNCLPLPESELI